MTFEGEVLLLPSRFFGGMVTVILASTSTSLSLSTHLLLLVLLVLSFFGLLDSGNSFETFSIPLFEVDAFETTEF